MESLTLSVAKIAIILKRPKVLVYSRRKGIRSDLFWHMKEKILFVILLVFLAIFLPAQTGLKIILEEKNGRLTIIGSQGKTRELVIPEIINGMPITAIGEGAFTAKGLALVSIPDSVTEIGDGAFSFNELTTLVIGNGVETVGRKAFSNNKLSDLTIGPYAFFHNVLTNVTIPNSVTTIGEGAFSSNRIHSVLIGEGVREIGDGAFFNNRLASITIPSNLSALGKRVFESLITRRSSVPQIDYLFENGEILYTTSNNFETYFASTGKRAGSYRFSRDGWAYEE